MIYYNRVIKMYKISKEMALIIRAEMKNITKVHVYKKLEVVALRGEGYSNDEISEITKYNSNYVSELCKQFITQGIESFCTDWRKGGNHRTMNDKQAEDFLNRFKEKAENGEVTTIKEIAIEYDKATGKERKSNSSVYYFLHAHGWRMVVPMSQHPGKASDEVMEASKKLTMSWRQ